MYEFQSRVRYSETDEEGMLTISALINYFQDCCSFQSEDIGRGVRYLREHACAWVLGGWEIALHRMPRYTEEIVIRTWPVDFKGFFGYRNFELRTVSGECLAQASTTWIFVDTDSGRPQRVTEDMAQAYVCSPELPLERPKRHLKLDESGQIYQCPPVTVLRGHLDTNHHMNNGQYVLIAQECMMQEAPPSGGRLCGLRVLYRKEAVLGDVLYPRVSVSGNRRQAELANDQGQPYAIVEFEYTLCGQ